MLALPKNIRIIPSRSFDVNAGIAQLVEHDLAKVGVASSSLVSRSILNIKLCGNSSVGRAQPCQGWGREFEPRFPLQIHNPSLNNEGFFLSIILIKCGEN